MSYRLDPDGDGTRILFERTGFDLSQPWGDTALRGAEFGWARMLERLSSVVAGWAAKTIAHHSYPNSVRILTGLLTLTKRFPQGRAAGGGMSCGDALARRWTAQPRMGYKGESTIFGS